MFFETFIYEHANIFIVIVYICVKNTAIFYVESTKKIFFSLFSLFNFSFKKIHKHPACKMNRDEQGGADQKFEVLNEHTF